MPIIDILLSLRKKMKTWAIIGLIFSTQCYATTEADIFSLINERLSYMEDVALYKHNYHICIENVEVEKNLLKGVREYAENHRIDEESLVKFFKTQIEAAKVIQYRKRADYLMNPPDEKAPDLNTNLRPMIKILGQKINHQIKNFLNEGETFETSSYKLFEDSIDTYYLTRFEKQKLFEALLSIQLDSKKI